MLADGHGATTRAAGADRRHAAPGRHPDDPRLAELVAALTEASPEFRDWWAEYPVRYFRPATIGIKHPGAGPIRLQMFQLRLVDQPDLIAVIQVPADETSADRVRSLLAAGAGGHEG